MNAAMTDIQKLNALLRLRLLFPTERELSQYIGYQLRGNHFNKFKPFQCKAYLCEFSTICLHTSNGRFDLEQLLSQYEATSRWYVGNMAGRNVLDSDETLSDFMRNVYLHHACLSPKVQALGEDFRQKKLSAGLLLLLAKGLIPTFNNKRWQDIGDIVADFQRAYDTLSYISHHINDGFEEHPCLKEIRMLIDEGKNGERTLNRLMLIHVVSETLDQVFALKQPQRMLELFNKMRTMNFDVDQLWRNTQSPENEVWQFSPLDTLNGYALLRFTIDYQRRTMHYTRYTVFFRSVGVYGKSYTVVLRPAATYFSLLKRELPADAMMSDYTTIELSADGKQALRLTFNRESPIGKGSLTLTPTTKSEQLYYTKYINEWKWEDDSREFAVSSCTLQAASTFKALFFSFSDGVFRLDKYHDGKETVNGIASLTHHGNYVYAELLDNGQRRRFLCIDLLNTYLDMDELLTKPYFKRIETVEELLV